MSAQHKRLGRTAKQKRRRMALQHVEIYADTQLRLAAHANLPETKKAAAGRAKTLLREITVLRSRLGLPELAAGAVR